MTRRAVRTAFAPATLALLLPLALVVTGCGDCGGGGGDAGPDAGQGRDAGGEGQCEFLGGDCSEDSDCCNALVCLAEGVCGNAPRCQDDDSFAGTPTSPADLEDLGDDTPLACQGFPFLDVFTVEADAGEILLLSLETVGLPAFTTVAQGDPDIDVYLLGGPPTGVVDGIVEGPVLAAGATLSSTEQVVFEAAASGTYYVAVTLYDGPDGAYSLSLDRRAGCDFDADCGVDEFCQVAVEAEFLVVLQQCATWTPPGCGEGDDEAGGDVHSDSDAVTLTGAIDGRACAGDIDVFTFERVLEERSQLTLSAADLGDDLLVASIVDESGALLDVVTLDEAMGSVDYTLGVGTPAGRFWVYLEQFGPGSSEALYTLTLDRQAACRTDADCSDGRTCGDEVFGGGPTQACVIADDPCADDDDDNSRTSATSVAPGADVTAAVCMGGQDVYEIVLEQPVSDVEISIDWTGPEDLDLYVYAEDGTLLGAGWYGNGGEVWEGIALPAQRLYAWVSAYACGFDQQGSPVACADLHEYTIAVEEKPATVCDADTDCFVGGVSANDPFSTLACRSITVSGGAQDAGPDPVDAGDGDDAGEPADGGADDAGEGDAGDEPDDDAGAEPGDDAGDEPEDDAGAEPDVDAGTGDTTTVQACVRPIEPKLLEGQGGDACFDSYDCSTLFCIDSYCSTTCEGGEAACDAALGADGYCFELTQTPICLAACASDDDCDRVFGADANLTCAEGECVQ